MKKLLLSTTFLAFCAFLIWSCNKDEEISTNPHIRLSFSTDTVSFDTVFTTIGSTTQRFTVRNPESRAINISRIRLASGNKSPFRLNINGLKSIDAENIQLSGRDSLFIFVEATIDPTGENLPMIINDSVVFDLNGNSQSVKLLAFGQDVHLLNGQHIQTEHWINDKPYLIYNSAKVDSLNTLTIDPGCRIHFHKNSSLFVNGTLKANGTFEEPISFGGDRLEKEYENIPGQWGHQSITKDGNLILYGGIHFLQGSKNNRMDYVVIRNADKGIQLDSLGLSPEPMLTISNSRIENMTLNCIEARTSNIEAWNCIFANSGSYTVALLFGGNYRFRHCTIANYFSSGKHAEPALIVNNYYKYEDAIYSFNLEKAEFSNCIIYGMNNNELALAGHENAPFNYNFSNCLIKNQAYKDAGSSFNDVLFNLDPAFTDEQNFDFSLDSISPARNIGNMETARLIPLDLNNNSRLADEGPDLGALEWISDNQ